VLAKRWRDAASDYASGLKTPQLASQTKIAAIQSREEKLALKWDYPFGFTLDLVADNTG
jgi:hypothetical protein